MRKIKLQKGLISGYVAIGVMAILTAGVLRLANQAQISADTAATATPTAVAGTYTFTGCVDGSDTLTISGSTTTIKHRNFDQIGHHASCPAELKGVTGDNGPFYQSSGDLTGCTKVAMAKLLGRGEVTLKQDTTPFQVFLNDDDTDKAAVYSFNLTCTAWASTPTPTATSTTISLKQGYNAISIPDSLGYASSADFIDVSGQSMTVFDINILGGKNWRRSDSSSNLVTMKAGIGYYIYNPNEERTITLGKHPVADAAKQQIWPIRRGWNLVANNTGQAYPLSSFVFPVINANQDNACSQTNSSCYTTYSLRDLLTGDASTSRAYQTLFLITDTHTIEASKAFQQVAITSSNLSSVTIPANTDFWIYLFE